MERPYALPYSRALRACLAIVLLGGAVWLSVLAILCGAVAVGRLPAGGLTNALAALLLTPALALCTVPLLEAAVALLLGKASPGRWYRIMVEAGAALVFVLFATTISTALWPAVAVLALATIQGFAIGFLHWQPSAPRTHEPVGVPLVLLLLGETRRGDARPIPVVTEAPPGDAKRAA